MIEPGKLDMILSLRSRGISDARVLRRIETVPRARFVPPELIGRAYDETVLPIACGQSMLSPLQTAIFAQSLDVEAKHKVLLIGLGSGYLAAVLAGLAKRVFATDRFRGLVELADQNLARAEIGGVITRWSDGRYGWQGQAPFDRIAVCADMRTVPSRLEDQIRVNGMLLGTVGGQLVQLRKARKHLTQTELFPLEVDPLQAGKSEAL